MKKHRGEKLKIDDKIFSGEVYSGEDGQTMGLVDGLGSMVDILESKYPGSKLDIQEQKSFANNFLAMIWS